ncbi:MAG: AI-2E family transporter [Actinophytocola sp.]|uniref:AI-2E family transporter n=1 Tax=Actinophytocola sp. TaxID=1872138 RepID=UPI003C708792
MPGWLRRAGTTGWLLTGVIVAAALVVFVLMVTRPLLLPVVVMAGAATIAEPLVGWLARRGVPRVLGAVVVSLLVLAVLAFVIVVFVIGVVDQWDKIVQVATDAVDRARDLLSGIPSGTELVDNADAATSRLGPTLAVGVLSQITAGVAGVATALVGVLVAVYVLLLVLADAPRIHARIVGWIPGPPGFGKEATERAANTTRRYFVGLTWIALMNAVVISLGALVLGVPFAVGIGVLCFVAAYIPYVGAFLSGAFAVLLALGSGGTGTALAMVGVVILANSVLENLARPLTFGAVLRLHPLVILLVTLAGGVLGGAIGMMIAPPVAAITSDLARQIRQARADGDRADSGRLS